MKKRTLIIVLSILLILLGVIVVNVINKNRDYCYYLDSPVRVVYITDQNYVTYMRTSIRSIIANKAPDTNVQVYVLGYNLRNKDKKKILQEARGNTRIKIIGISDELLKNFNERSTITSNITRVDNAKFFLPSILDDVDRVIYLDGDTIVLKDLSELYNTDLEGNYIGAADDWQSCWNDDYNKRYFNNGVMLLDLKKMREDNISEKLVDFKKNDKVKRFMTQDAFNNIMYGKVKYISLLYDTFAPEYDSKYVILSRLIGVLKNNYSYESYPYVFGVQYQENTVIIHYCGYYYLKPWQGLDFKKESNRIWYKYAPIDFWLQCLKGECKVPEF